MFSLSLLLHLHDDRLPNHIRAPAGYTSPVLPFFEPSFIAIFGNCDPVKPEDFGSRATGDFLIERINDAMVDKAPWRDLPPHELRLQGWLCGLHSGAILSALPFTVKHE
jgi:hypothetical protein